MRKLYFHIAGMGDYESVLVEMLTNIKEVGLFDELDSLTFLVSGPATKEAYIKSRKLINEFSPMDKTVVLHHPNLKDYEYPTLQLLYEDAKKNPSDQYLYIHTKGVSRPSPYRKYWRRAMMLNVVDKYKECLEHLKTHDAVGYSWKRDHFSGNFWWANGSLFSHFKGFDWLRKNPVPCWDEADKDRLQCEFFWCKIGKKIVTRNIGFIHPYDAIYVDPQLELDYKGDPFDDIGIKDEWRFIINMDTRPDKMKYWKNIMKARGVRPESFTRQEGFPGRSTGIDAVDMFKYPEAIRTGTMGCTITHWFLVNNAYQKKFPYLLVMEDDATPVRGFGEYLIDAWKVLPDDWDILWVGGYERHNQWDMPTRTENFKGINFRWQVTENLYTPGDVWGTHCYILSERGIKKVRDYFANNRIVDHIDITYSRHVGLYQYSFIPSLVKQGDIQSDIH